MNYLNLEQVTEQLQILTAPTYENNFHAKFNDALGNINISIFYINLVKIEKSLTENKSIP